MAIPRLGGANVGLGAGQGLVFSNIGAPQGITNAVTLSAGMTFLIPAGTYQIAVGAYTYLQWLDPISNIWKNMPTAVSHHFVSTDGTNWRLANTTGCVVGAFITTGGAGGPSSTVSAIGQTAASLTITSSGSPTYVPIVGGALSTSGAPVCSTGGVGQTAGTGYTFLPSVVIDAPPVGGIQATAIVTALSGGTIGASGTCLTYVNQGAGYTTVPNITIVPDPRDLTGTGGTFTGTNAICTAGALTGSGVLTGLLVTNHGQSFTSSGTAPAITFVTGGAGWTTLPAASGIMNWCITSGITSGIFVTVPTVTSGTTAVYATTYAMRIPGAGSTNTGSLVVGNPDYDVNLDMPRPARFNFLFSGAVLSTGANPTPIDDAGLGIQRVPQLSVAWTTSGAQTLVAYSASGILGGSPTGTDTSYIQRI